MTREQWAKRLSGRETRCELSIAEDTAMLADGIVVVYGYSDDETVFRGTWKDSIYSYSGRTHNVTSSGVLVNECENEDCPYIEKEKLKCTTIEAVWCALDSPTWTFKTDIPHSTFDVLEDGEVFCRGIVFHAADVGKPLPLTWEKLKLKRREPVYAVFKATGGEGWFIVSYVHEESLLLSGAYEHLVTSESVKDGAVEIYVTMLEELRCQSGK